MTTPYLKGNYELPEQAPRPEASRPQAPAPAEDLEMEFERAALQKLGGSIAFVKKGSAFLWKGSPRDASR